MTKRGLWLIYGIRWGCDCGSSGRSRLIRLVTLKYIALRFFKIHYFHRRNIGYIHFIKSFWFARRLLMSILRSWCFSRYHITIAIAISCLTQSFIQITIIKIRWLNAFFLVWALGSYLRKRQRSIWILHQLSEKF